MKGILDHFAADIRRSQERRLLLLRGLHFLPARFPAVFPPRRDDSPWFTRAVMCPSARATNADPELWYAMTRLFDALRRRKSQFEIHARALEIERFLEMDPPETPSIPIVLDHLPDILATSREVEILDGPPFDQKRVAALFHDACQFITHIHPCLAQYLPTFVRCILPIPTPAAFHRSFTLSRVSGLLFIGATDRVEVAAEAIVHEFGHTVLHRVAEIEKLTERNDETDVYYSPWRTDARPAEGLLHAIFVSILIRSLWVTVATESADPSMRRHAAARLTKIGYQLQLGLASIRSAPVLELGRRVLALAGECLSQPLADDVARHSLPILDEVKADMKRWQGRHPHLAHRIDGFDGLLGSGGTH